MIWLRNLWKGIYNMNVVHDSDMKDFLKSIEEYKKVKEGNVNCYFCGEQIDFDNILGVFPYENSIKYSCKDCICELIELKEGY